MKRFKFLNLITNILLALFVGVVVMTTLAVNPYVVALGVLAVGCLYTWKRSKSAKTGMVYMALQVQMWDSTIEKELYKNNEFLRHSKKADGYVTEGKYVHIPQQGTGAEVVVNPQSFPLEVSEQEDTDVMYQLDLYATKPKRIGWSEIQELSYDFRASTIENDLNKIKETMAERMLHNWISSPLIGSVAATTLPAAHVLAATGANGTNNAEATSATGHRKTYSLNDLQRMRALAISQNSWYEGHMYAMLTPQAQIEIAPADSVVTATYMQKVSDEDRKKGVYMEVQGWKILTRSSVLRTQADGTLRAIGETGASTDQSACFFWADIAVEYAQGEVKMFEKLNDPQFLGDVYNWAARTGGRARRDDYKGVYLLRQAATA